MSNFSHSTIGFANFSQAATVAELIRAMDFYYRPNEELPSQRDYTNMVALTLKSREGTRFLVARTADGRPVGLACVAIMRPGRDLKGLIYLKDLFVVAEARGHGIGSRLLQFLATFASENGIARIDFTTDHGNLAAQRLYVSLGAVVQKKIYYSLPVQTMQHRADNLKPTPSG